MPIDPGPMLVDCGQREAKTAVTVARALACAAGPRFRACRPFLPASCHQLLTSFLPVSALLGVTVARDSDGHGAAMAYE